MPASKERSSNDQRADVKNPNNKEHEADMENRKKLGHLDDKKDRDNDDN